MTDRILDVVIIGAGASGIGAAARLRAHGSTDFVVLEKAPQLGGTWRDNTYPGCACDVPSALYSFSFAPNPEWTRAFAEQPEILAYLGHTATHTQVDQHVRFNTEVLEARWVPQRSWWRLHTTGGEYLARNLIAAAGPWHEPYTPDIPGLSGFGGSIFHSSRWDHDVELTDKRVAVVGSGASAVQFVPRIASLTRRLHLFQRTPQWVLPKPDHYVPDIERWLMRTLPAAQRALRAGEYWAMEALVFALRHPRTQPILRGVGRAHLRRSIKDARLRRILTPPYMVGCKRLLVSNDYYPALALDTVHVHPTALQEVRGNTLIGADGTAVDADVLILGTGFRILDMPIADRVLDGAGHSLAEQWQGSPRAYLGTTVAGFPNLFLMLGPSLGTATSAFVPIEAQITYIIDALGHLQSSGATTIEVREQVQNAFNTRVQNALGGTVYNAGGCQSYFFDKNGRNSFSWPWSGSQMTRTLSQFDPLDFHLRTDAQTGVPA